MPDDKTILIKTAYSYYQKGDWDRAIDEYHKLADLDPKDLNVHNILADIYSKKGDVSEAMKQYDLVAQGYDQKGQFDKVLQVYRRMLKMTPNDTALASAIDNLADKYLERAAQLEVDEPEKASDIYRSILKAEPERIQAGLKYARILFNKGSKFEAIECLLGIASQLDPETQNGPLSEVYEGIISLDPSNIEAREKLITSLEKSGRNTDSLKPIRDLIDIHIRQNDPVKAELWAKKAVDLGDTSAYYQLGVVYFNQHKYPDAKWAFEKFLQVQETHVGALKYLALCSLRLGLNAEAVQSYLRILDVYFNENLLDEAKEVRQTILELDPGNQTIHRYPLGIIENPTPVTDEPSQTSATVEPSADTGKQQESLEQAATYVQRGLYEQAIDIYLDILKRWPDLPNIRTYLQQTYSLMAQAAEPVAKQRAPEEIKAELEAELREQMKRELDEQTKAIQEHQRAIELQQQMEQERLLQQSKILEQVQSAREEELRQKMMVELEAKQKTFEEEKARIEKEKNEAAEKLRQEMENAKNDIEQRLREQLKKEMDEKLENESRLQTALKAQEDQRKTDEERRRVYESQKQEKEAARAKINQEIFQGMERLRMEKEKEIKPQPVTAMESVSEAPIHSPEKTEPAPPTLENLDDPFIRMTLADIYAKQGLYLEALKIYEKILNEEPNNEDVREKLRTLLRSKGI